MTQERNGIPFRCTVQAPHKALPQPNFVPVIPSTSRKTHSKGMSPSTSTSCSTPLTFILKGIDQPSRGLTAPFCRLRHDNGMRVMQCKANLWAAPNVCFGSLEDIRERIRDVRFTPESRHSPRQFPCPLCAITGSKWFTRSAQRSGSHVLQPAQLPLMKFLRITHLRR